MKRKALFVFLAVIVFFTAVAYAEEISGSANVTAVGRYLWRGQILNDEPAVQPQLVVDLNKFEVTYWGSIPDETDLTIKFGDSLPFAEIVSLNGGFTSYMYHFAPPGSKYSVEIFTGVSVDTFLSPYLTFYYDTMQGNGGYAEIGVSQSHEVGPIEVNGSVSAGYNFGQYRETYSPSFTAVLVNLGATYDIAGSGVKITPALIGQIALSGQYKNILTWSVGMNYEFKIGGGDKKEDKKEE